MPFLAISLTAFIVFSTSAVEAGLLGWKMILNDSEFHYGDGIVESNVENTINAVSEIAREGMRSTDDEIIQIMIKS